MIDKLAVLIPTYNGGQLLRDSIDSCAAAGLTSDDYEIVVVDNCSTDGSVEHLPELDQSGAYIRVYRNPENFGRIGNWNRALEIAQSAGFTCAAFLFVGDRWIAGGSLPKLLARVKESGATLGMSAAQICENSGQPVQLWKRISVRKGDHVSSTQAVQRSIELGHLPFAPIQANIYRLFPDSPLRFDADQPLTTDVEATIQYLHQHPGPVVVTNEPYLAWRIHLARYSANLPLERTMHEETMLLERVSAATHVPVNWSSANAKYLLSGLFGVFVNGSLRDRITHVPRLVRFIARRPGGVSIKALGSLVMKKFVWKESYVSFH